jgi:hypothetical protein
LKIRIYERHYFVSYIWKSEIMRNIDFENIGILFYRSF